MDAWQDLGIRLILAIQGLSPALDGVMQFFSFLGRIEFYMLFLTFLYWVVDARLGFRVLVALVSTDILGITAKLVFRQPRPYWISDVKPLSLEPSYGLPSTHASDSLPVWGYMAVQAKKRWLWVVAVATILLISFSRLYLGVHFPHDVLGGWLIGLIVLLLILRYEGQVSVWLNTRSIAGQIGLGFAASMVFILLGVAARALIAANPDPASWTEFTVGSRTLTSYFTLAGTLFGASAGYALMLKKANFQTAGSTLQKLARYGLGILGVLMALYGLDALFSLIAADETVLGYILRYLRYGTGTFWAMFGAPWVFLKWGLAKLK